MVRSHRRGTRCCRELWEGGEQGGARDDPAPKVPLWPHGLELARHTAPFPPRLLLPAAGNPGYLVCPPYQVNDVFRILELCWRCSWARMDQKSRAGSSWLWWVSRSWPVAGELGFPACVGWDHAGYLFRWVCLGVKRFAFLTFRKERGDPASSFPLLLIIVVCRPSIHSVRVCMYMQAWVSTYLLILESNLQIISACSGLRVLAEVGSTFLLQQSPVPGTLPARRGWRC